MKFLQILTVYLLLVFNAFADDVFKFDPAALVSEYGGTWGRWENPYRIFAFDKKGIAFEKEPKDWSWYVNNQEVIGLNLNGSFQQGESFKVTAIRGDGTKEEFETRYLLAHPRVQAILDEAKRNNKKLKFVLKKKLFKGDRKIEISILDEERDPEYVAYLLNKASSDYIGEVGRVGYRGSDSSAAKGEEALLEEPVRAARSEESKPDAHQGG